MARQLRVTFDGAIYHVYHRGACRRDTFLSDLDRRDFLTLLGDIYSRYALEIHAYCLMDNHYHLLVCTPRGNISEPMRYLNSVYTQRFNRRHGRDGPLFRGRFGSQLVADEQYLRVLSPYIHLNPVRAGLVDSPARFAWSSYAAYLDEGCAPSWLHDGLILGAFGGRRLHRAFVERVVTGDIATPDVDLNVPVLATPGTGEELLADTPRSRETDPSRHRAEQRPSIERIARLVALECGVPLASMSAPLRGRPNTPRDIAVGLAQSLGTHRQRDIAAFFGYSDAASTSASVSRFKRRRHTHADLDAYVSAVERSIARGL